MKFLFLLASLLPALASGAVNLKNNGGEVSFLAVGKPSMLKIKGHADKPDAHFSLSGANLSGTTEIDMDKFATGISLRDKHMKEKYLETASYPKAKLTIKDVNVGPGFADNLGAPSTAFEGTLAFHGKERAVKGTFSASNGAVTAKFPLTLSDFGVAIPSYLGVTVAENVEVEANLPLTKE
jgi:polyisoprenoid-binding protein YceI